MPESGKASEARQRYCSDACQHSACHGHRFLKDPWKGAGPQGAYFAPLVPLLPFTKRKRGLEGTDAHGRRPGQNRSEQ